MARQAVEQPDAIPCWRFVIGWRGNISAEARERIAVRHLNLSALFGVVTLPLTARGFPVGVVGGKLRSSCCRRWSRICPSAPCWRRSASVLEMSFSSNSFVVVLRPKCRAARTGLQAPSAAIPLRVGPPVSLTSTSVPVGNESRVAPASAGRSRGPISGGFFVVRRFWPASVPAWATPAGVKLDFRHVREVSLDQLIEDSGLL